MIGTVDRAARILADLRTREEGSEPIDDLPEEIRPRSLMQAYSVQSRVRQLLARRAPGQQIGWKIGCTTRVMQDYLRIPHPCAGTLYDGSVVIGHAELRASDYYSLGLECEIAVVLGEDLTQIAATYTPETIAPAVSHAMASIEIVEHRFNDTSKAEVVSLVADDFFSAGCVIGEPVEIGALPDLATLRGGFSIDGHAPQVIGSGAEILEHPYNALAWLAIQCAGLGTPLLAGQMITLGSIVKTIYPTPGQRIEALFDGLPSARVQII